MWKTNLKVLAIALVVVGFYTTVAHIIPQLQSEVPEALALGSGVTPEALVAAGEKIYNGAGGCTACHGLGTRAPNLITDYKGQGAIGARCGMAGGGVRLSRSTRCTRARAASRASIEKGFTRKSEAPWRTALTA